MTASVSSWTEWVGEWWTTSRRATFTSLPYRRSRDEPARAARERAPGRGRADGRRPHDPGAGARRGRGRFGGLPGRRVPDRPRRWRRRSPRCGPRPSGTASTCSRPNPVPVDPAAYAAYRELLLPLAERYGVDLPATPVEDDDGWQDKVDVLVEAAPPVVSFTFGLPGPDGAACAQEQAGCTPRADRHRVPTRPGQSARGGNGRADRPVAPTPAATGARSPRTGRPSGCGSPTWSARCERPPTCPSSPPAGSAPAPTCAPPSMPAPRPSRSAPSCCSRPRPAPTRPTAPG